MSTDPYAVQAGPERTNVIRYPAPNVVGLAARRRYGRCSCGRPINRPGVIFCAECD